MRKFRLRKRRGVRPGAGAATVYAVALAGAGLLVAGCCGSAGKKANTETPASMAAPAPSSGGMKAYVDPVTGELTDRPPAGTPAGPGDVIVPRGQPRKSPVPGGGVMVGPGEDSQH